MSSYFRISPTTLDFVRSGYGLFLVLFLTMTLPQARRFFVSDRWRGYAKSSPGVDLIQNPVMVWVVMALWFACAAALTVGTQTVLAGFLNFLLCRYFFVSMRWRGILRGGGAPGFMTYWWSAAVFFLEYARLADDMGLLGVALVAFKVDWAFIMLNSGAYKFLAGYPQNQGMELGMINPWWGYWGRLQMQIPPDSVWFRFCNHAAWLTEIVAAILMLIPATQFLGGMLITGSCLCIALNIRLGWLCEMVMLIGFLYVAPGTWPDRWLAEIGLPSESVQWFPIFPTWAHTALRGFFWAYLLLLPLAHIGHFYEFLSNRRLPGLLG
jgi:hypothetical protein